MVAAAMASAVGAWEFDKAYALPELPVLAQSGGSETPFYFATEKTGSPKSYARLATPVRLSGFGGLVRDPGDATGSTFWMLDDRGLSSAYETSALKARVFALPNYHQKLVKMRLEGGTLKVLEIDSIASLESATVFTTGLPTSKQDNGEVALKGNLVAASVDEIAVLSAVPNGYDFEALRILPSGNFLAADELGPFFVEIDKVSKRIVKEWYPGNGLPKVFAKRRDNRGFEAMAVTPSGKVVAMLQSPADNSSSTNTKDSRMVRVLWFDPVAGTNREYVYLVDLKGNSKRLGSETKIGDMVALSETRFLAIEHGEDGQGKYWVDLVEFDIASATDIHDPQDHGKGLTFWKADVSKLLTPEEIGMDTATSVWSAVGIVPVTKSVRMGDLLSDGGAWTSRKPEGLELLGDTAVALLNDNDYGAQDKNSDGIPHILPDAERVESIVYLKLPQATGIRSRKSVASEGTIRMIRIGGDLQVRWENGENASLRLRDKQGRILARGESRGGTGTVALDGVPSGTHLLEVVGSSSRVSTLVQVVR